LRVRATAVTADTRTRRNTTARRAAEILVQKDLGYVIPTGKQKKNLAVAFVKRDMIVYGKAFDIVRLSVPVDLDHIEEIERHLENVTLYEIKGGKHGWPGACWRDKTDTGGKISASKLAWDFAKQFTKK
jgi:dienelactone hydrolase